MYVTVNDGLAQQVTETARFLTGLAEAGNQNRNDYHRFRPTLELLDRYAVAIHAAKVPLTSFLGSGDLTGARFEAGNGSSVAVALDQAVTYLRDPDVSGIPVNALSMYEFKLTTEALGLLKGLHFNVLASIRKAAEADLHEMVASDVERFLSTAELIRTWTSAGGSGEDSSDDR